MINAASRAGNQPAPPHIVFEALTEPNRDPARPWLQLQADERHPHPVEVDKPHLVVWSSLWTKRDDAMVRFDLSTDSLRQGTELRWTLLVEDPMPEHALLEHMRKRLNQLINANLRYTFGQ